MPAFAIAALIAVPLASFVGGIIYKKYPKLKQDNPIEEYIEEVIKQQTGMDVDLSPDTPEVKNGNQ